MRLLIIDNHDSFVYNIVGLLRDCIRRGAVSLSWTIEKNDAVSFDRLHEYDALILSPGPGLPSEAGSLMRVIDLCADTKPMLGICLGCQAIAEYFGASLRHLDRPRHGHLSHLTGIGSDDELMGVFASRDVAVGRYHSWVVSDESLPTQILVGARDEEGNIMSLRHVSLPIFGTQFHPESIVSGCGIDIMERFLSIVSSRQRQ